MDTRYLKRRGNRWYVRVRVPSDVIEHLGEFYTKATGESDLRKARQRRHAILADFYDEVERARAGKGVPEVEIARRYYEDLRVIAQEPDPETRENLKLVLAEVMETQLAKLGGRDEEGHPIAAHPETDRIIREAHGSKGGRESTLSRAVKDYLDHIEGQVRHATWTEKKSVLDSMVGFFEPGFRVADFDKAAASKYVRDHLLPSGKAPRTVRKQASITSAFLGWAEAADLVEVNPMPAINKLLPKVPRGQARRAWEPEEVLKVLETFEERGKRLWSRYFSILLYTGARAGEIAELRTEDAQDGILRIYEDREAGRHVKTESSVRNVPIHPVIQPVIDAMREESTDDFLLPGLRRAKSRDGSRAHTIGNKMMQVVREKAKVTDPKLVLHGLRNTWETAAGRAGVSKEMRDFITGHKAQDVATVHYYGGPAMEQLEKAIRKVSFGPEVDAYVKKLA
ncbi:DUF6538 domain-containing protein [Lentisalinibacter salinarum]|uniref:DUF6538 domain-containing protein n=1 Tax=Lentisalinibacter salinarum TaxID=2992239 RepID=UPI00386D03D2